MTERTDFWMLYAEGGSAPQAKHPTYAEALHEASRIAAKPNVARVFILHAEAVLERADPPLELHVLPNSRASLTSPGE